MNFITMDEAVIGLRRYETELYAKLQEMVPTIPRDRELSKLEIINHVIDYIDDLMELVADNKP